MLPPWPWFSLPCSAGILKEAPSRVHGLQSTTKLIQSLVKKEIPIWEWTQDADSDPLCHWLAMHALISAYWLWVFISASIKGNQKMLWEATLIRRGHYFVKCSVAHRYWPTWRWRNHSFQLSKSWYQHTAKCSSLGPIVLVQGAGTECTAPWLRQQKCILHGSGS